MRATEQVWRIYTPRGHATFSAERNLALRFAARVAKQQGEIVQLLTENEIWRVRPSGISSLTPKGDN